MNNVHIFYGVGWLIMALVVFTLPYGWRSNLPWKPSVPLSQKRIVLLIRASTGVMAILALFLAGGAGEDLIQLTEAQQLLGGAMIGLIFAEPIGWFMRGVSPGKSESKQDRAYAMASRSVGVAYLIWGLVEIILFK